MGKIIIIPVIYVAWKDVYNRDRLHVSFNDQQVIEKVLKRYDNVFINNDDGGKKKLRNRLYDDIIDLNDGTFGSVNGKYELNTVDDLDTPINICLQEGDSHFPIAAVCLEQKNLL